MNLFELFWQNVLLAFQAVGGAMATLPGLEKLGWMDEQTLAHLAAIGQASPGPNMLLLPLVGWKMAGIPGALVAAIGFCLPSAVLVLILYHRWGKLKDSITKKTLQAALAPIGAAAVLASTLTFGQMAGITLPGSIALAIVAFLSIKTKTPPVLLIAAGGILGGFGFI